MAFFGPLSPLLPEKLSFFFTPYFNLIFQTYFALYFIKFTWLVMFGFTWLGMICEISVNLKSRMAVVLI